MKQQFCVFHVLLAATHCKLKKKGVCMHSNNFHCDDCCCCYRYLPVLCTVTDTRVSIMGHSVLCAVTHADKLCIPQPTANTFPVNVTARHMVEL